MSLIMNPLPPQAYTKDTLVQAYAWLQAQSDSVKEMATNPDILVSLFLKTKSQGDQFFERPSIQNFKNELKSLAGMMGEFEQSGSPQLPPAPQTHVHQQNFAPSAPSLPSPSAPSMTPPSASLNPTLATPAAPQSYSQFLAQQTLANSSSAQIPPSAGVPSQALIGADSAPPLLDEKSLEMIREVKKALNLTSDSEVLRLLLAIGYQKARQLYK